MPSWTSDLLPRETKNIYPLTMSYSQGSKNIYSRPPVDRAHRAVLASVEVSLPAKISYLSVRSAAPASLPLSSSYHLHD